MKKFMSKHGRFLRNLGLLGLVGMLLFSLGSGGSAKSADKHIRNRVVKLRSGQGSCSGEQIRAPSGRDYILSAGHCRVLEDKDGNIEVVLENKKSLMRRVIAEDRFSDLLLIEGVPNLSGLDVASSWHPNQEVITYTHGNGYDTYTTRGSLIQLEHILVYAGEIRSAEDSEHCQSMPKFKEIEGWLGNVCVLDVTEVVTTASIVPGSSGGAVLDENGDLLGVVSAGANGSIFGYLVPLHDIKRFISGY